MQRPRARPLPRPFIVPFDPNPLAHGFILSTHTWSSSRPSGTIGSGDDCKNLSNHTVGSRPSPKLPLPCCKPCHIKVEPDKEEVLMEKIPAYRVVPNPRARRITFTILWAIVTALLVVIGRRSESHKLIAILLGQASRWRGQFGDLTSTASAQVNAVVRQLEQRVVGAYQGWLDLGSISHTVVMVAELWRRMDAVEISLSALSEAPNNQGENPLLPNYALLAVGATVELDMTSASFGTIHGWGPWKRIVKQIDPTVVLQGTMGVGNCWAFEGASGQIGVWLSRGIRVTHLIFDYPPISVLHDKRSLPQDFSLWVKLSGTRQFYESFFSAFTNPSHPLGPWKMMYAGAFKFQPSNSGTQLFTIPTEVTDSWLHDNFSTDGIVVQFHTNWGNPKATCIYGIRIHGVPAMQ